MDFAMEGLNQLLKSIDEKLDSETKTAVLAACSEACTQHWAAQAQEIRRQFLALQVTLMQSRLRRDERGAFAIRVVKT